VLTDVAASGVKTIQAGETAAISGLQGKASVQQVVDAVMSAEQTLQTAVAIRDKVIAAYQDITRMAI
jgi:flagellar hook-basal body complex protein FliE